MINDNIQKCTLDFPDALNSATAAKLIREKKKEGWGISKQYSYDALNKIFTYYFERETVK